MNPRDLSLTHLNLTVADIDRSIAFYRRWFGFESEPQRYDDGTVFIRNGDGFDLALHADAPTSTGVHFGFRCSSPDVVRSLRTALTDAAIPIIETYDEDDFVSFKCLDPDGYQIEVYWEAPAATSG